MNKQTQTFDETARTDLPANNRRDTGFTDYASPVLFDHLQQEKIDHTK